MCNTISMLIFFHKLYISFKTCVIAEKFSNIENVGRGLEGT